MMCMRTCVYYNICRTTLRQLHIVIEDTTYNGWSMNEDTTYNGWSVNVEYSLELCQVF